MRLLVLRPEPGASATVSKAEALGLDAVAVPLFAIRAVSWEAPKADQFEGLLFTSANAIRHGGEGLSGLRQLPVYAVGAATADTARGAGFDVVETGNAGVDRLLDSIHPDLRLLHLCGANRHEPKDPRQQIAHVVVYRADPIDPPELPREPSIALVHSPRAGRRFSELVRDRSSTVVLAIGADAADAVGDGWKSVQTAAEPTDDALLALAARLCNKTAPK
jgi:uroporphyrinogen-III synthase